MVKKKIGWGESSGADDPHDREGLGSEDTQQQHTQESTDSHGTQNSNVSSEGGTSSADPSSSGTGTGSMNNSNTAGGENGTKELYDPFASTDSDTDSVKKVKEAENFKYWGKNNSSLRQHAEEESDEFSDIEPPPPEQTSEEKSKTRDGQEKYDPLQPTDDPSPAPTPPPFTPVEEDDRFNV